ncbi:MAG: outer membrane beta-barrel protein [Bacteroidota bacterium]
MKYLLGVLLVGLSASAIAQTKDETVARPDLPGDLMVDIGLNFWDETPGGLDLQSWPSKSVGIYYTRRKAYGGKFALHYGVGLGLEKIGLGDDSTFFSGEALTIGELPIEQVDKNKLAITYLDIPIEFRFHPTGTQDGEGFFIGVGAIGGLRLNSHTKWRYTENGETKRQKISGEFNLNAWRYGVQIRLGFKGVHFFYKQFLSDTFKSSLNEVNPRLTTIGINITGF